MSAIDANILTQDSPRDVCGYEFVRWLKPQRTALCLSDQRKPIVLKLIGQDCLLDGQLHPDIKDRLARIRELPHRTIATLIGVERDRAASAWALWEYIEGTGFQTWTCDPMRDDRQVARMLRELVIAVEAMHGHGIIHGALHDGNVVVDEQGNVRLLDVSPLLFNDEQEDVSAISKLLATILDCRRKSAGNAAAETVLSRISAEGDLRQLSASISRTIQAGDQPAESPDRRLPADRAEARVRKLAMRWALICAAAALVLAGAGWALLADHGKEPPVAPAEALERGGK